jgi:hypothetical protein
MELIHNQIPLEFVSALPEGIKFIARQGKDFLVIEEVFCPDGHPLTVETVKIHGEPSIKIGVKIGKDEGNFFIDSFWGSHKKLYDFFPRFEKETVVVEAFCPTCGMSLMTEYPCEIKGCGTKSGILLTLPGRANKILVCGRLGCPGHRLDIRELPQRLTEKISDINFFGTGIDDFFGGI